MAFASIHIPGFLVQSVVRCEPAIRHLAIAIVDGIAPLWTVIAANEAARKAGIQLGMAKSRAAQFCATEIRHRSQPLEKAAHAALLDLGWSISPRVEDTAPDTILLDIAGLESLFGSARNIANELTQRAALLGLTANVAVASQIDAALLASRGFTGITVIPPGDEAQRLGLLPVAILGGSPETLETLDRWGVRTCGALAALPLSDLSERLGQEGVRLHELARGGSVRSMVPAQPNLIFEEEMELEDSVEELEPLAFILGRLLDQLCARLQARALAANAIRVRFELDPAFLNGLQRLPQHSPRPENKKPIARIFEKTMSLPAPMRDSKTLLKLLRLQLQADPPAAPILKVTLAADPARPRSNQQGLFLPTYPDPEKLELTVARLANLVGDSNIGSPELMNTHRPGQFRISQFLPPREDSEVFPKKKQPAKNDVPSEITETLKNRRPSTGFRIFRPAVPARVELRGEQPMRVSFSGMRGDVMVASGPWRTSGDWWREDTWQEAEWDLELRFESSFDANRDRQMAHANQQPSSRQGVYCVYFDFIRQGWFVRGIYD